MTALDRGCIARLVTVASRAPSGENCQPWRYHWDGVDLSIHHDAERARHPINHADHCSLLTLGGLLEALETAATAEGLHSQVSTTARDRGEPWARIRFERGELSASAQARARLALVDIEQRATDRRLYRRGSTTHPVFAQLAREAARFTNCRLRVLAHVPDELARYLEAADAYVLRHEEVMRDVLRWLRWSDREVDASCDGVSWRALGFPAPELRTYARLGRVDTWRHLRALGLEQATRTWLRLQLLSSAAFGVITVTSTNRDELVAAGRLLFLSWITLNRAGFAVQPLTHPAMSVYNLASGGLPSTTQPDFVRLFQQGRAVFTRSFGLSEPELPVWCFRTGVNRRLPSCLHSKRLPTSSILSFS